MSIDMQCPKHIIIRKLFIRNKNTLQKLSTLQGLHFFSVAIDFYGVMQSFTNEEFEPNFIICEFAL